MSWDPMYLEQYRNVNGWRILADQRRSQNMLMRKRADGN